MYEAQNELWGLTEASHDMGSLFATTIKKPGLFSTSIDPRASKRLARRLRNCPNSILD